MSTVTKTLLITETAMNKLIVQNDATVINTIFVNEYFQQSKSLPFALATVSTATATVVNKNVGTATITGRVTTTVSDQTSITSSFSASSSASGISSSGPTSLQISKSTIQSSSVEAAKASNSALVSPIAIPGFGNSSKNSNGTILGLAIGLPIALFIIGLVCLLGMFYYKRKYSTSDLEKDPKISKRDKLFSKIYGSKESNLGDKNRTNYDKENDDDYFHSAMNSKVTYRLSKPYISPPTLIKTPQKVAFPGNPYRKNKNINEETYSTSSLNQSQFPKPLASPFRKWTYESPLSRWFLTKSTLIQDKIQTVKTPTMHLKQLNILARVNKSKITVDDEIPYTESSPMLPTVPTSPYDSIQALPTGIRYESTSIPIKETDLTSGDQSIKPQVLETSKKSAYPPVIKLDKKIKSKPLPKPPSFVKSLDPEFRRHSNQYSVTEKHDLESARRSTIEEQAKLFQVVKDYQAVLMDEIHIKRGEIVRVLARHTDGWCLVERHDAVKSGSLDGPSYLNEDRGIVPGLCLQECS